MQPDPFSPDIPKRPWPDDGDEEKVYNTSVIKKVYITDGMIPGGFE